MLKEKNNSNPKWWETPSFEGIYKKFSLPTWSRLISLGRVLSWSIVNKKNSG